MNEEEKKRITTILLMDFYSSFAPAITTILPINMNKEFGIFLIFTIFAWIFLFCMIIHSQDRFF